MCGIIYVKSNNGLRVSKKILKLYDKQRSRGSDGFGYVAIKNGIIKEHVLREKEHEIRQVIKDSDANETLYHHRLPTSTQNLYEAAHPIKVDHPSLKHVYYVAHNGVITNAKTLYDAHKKEGYEYTTELRKETRIVTRDRSIHDSVEIKFNDSEALAIELARYVEGLSKEIGTRGSVAFIMLQVDRNTGKTLKVFFGRNTGNPLYFTKNNDMFVLKSAAEGGKEVEENNIFMLENNEISLFAKVDIGYHFKYEPYKYPSSDYKSTNYGFTSHQDTTKQQDKLNFDDYDDYTYVPEKKLTLPKPTVFHGLPGDTELSNKYELQLEKLQRERDNLEEESKENTQKLKEITNIREDDTYWDLIGRAEEIRLRLEEIDQEIDKIYELFFDSN